jgi:hypothetical protein
VAAEALPPIAVHARDAATRASRVGPWTSHSLYALTLLLAASLPFEPVRPLIALGWLDLNHLKLLVALTGLAWMATAVLGQSTGWREAPWGPLTKPAVLFLAIALASAVLAPEFRAQAVRFVGRLASGVYASFVAAEVARTRARLVGMLWAIVVGAGASACLGLAEVVAGHALDPLFATFKEAPSRVGGELRMSGSFQYATIAAVFLEMALALTIGLVLATRDRWYRWLASAVVLACSSAIVLTLTRAAFLAIGAILAIFLVGAWSGGWWRRLGQPAALGAIGMLGGVLALALGGQPLTTRLLTEDDRDWYHATYEAPAMLELTAREPKTVQIRARNTGQAAWTDMDEQQFMLAYRWLTADGQNELGVAGGEVPVPTTVRPGEEVTFQARITAELPPGLYRLSWGLLRHEVLWFAWRGSPEAETVVEVSGTKTESPAVAVPTARPRTDRLAVPAPVSRAALWRVALRLAAGRPLLGIGPDNFRHMYGNYLGLPLWDDHVHANSLYLELLADVGLLGCAAFGWLMLPVVRAGLGILRATPSPWAVAVVASLGAFFAHGLVDSFLEFTPIYLLFWMLVGLALASRRLTCAST